MSTPSEPSKWTEFVELINQALEEEKHKLGNLCASGVPSFSIPSLKMELLETMLKLIESLRRLQDVDMGLSFKAFQELQARKIDLDQLEEEAAHQPGHQRDYGWY